MADAEEKAPEGDKPEGEGEQPKVYSEEYLKEVIAERDKAKNKLRAIENEKRKAEESKLIEEGKLKEALALKDKELQEAQALKDELEKYRAADAARKEDLLKKLPESKREKYSQLSTDLLSDLISELEAAVPNQGPKPGSGEKSKDFDLMTFEEKGELKQKNPTLYENLFKESYKRKNGCYPSFIV